MPSLLPARLDHARDLALGGQLAERDARHAELAVIAARTPGHLAAVADARRRRVPRQFGEPELRDEPVLERTRLVPDDPLERFPLGGETLGAVTALLVTLHGADLSHCLCLRP